MSESSSASNKDSIPNSSNNNDTKTKNSDDKKEGSDATKALLGDLNTKNELKFRENLYRLIVSQLFYDGYQHIAVNLSGQIQVLFHTVFFLLIF